MNARGDRWWEPWQERDPCRVSRRYTRPQQALFDSPYYLTAAWGANGIGKSVGLAEYVRRAICGELWWQTPGPRTVVMAGNTWTQLGSTLRPLWDRLDPSWFRVGVRYESGGIKGQRLAVYDIVGGPGKGGELRLGTFRAPNLAGPRAEVVATDEPLPEDVHNELWPRLFGRDGRMVQTYTPTMGTAHKLDYLWDLVDDPLKPWAGEIHTPLSLDAMTPRGGLLEAPWVTQTEIDRLVEGLSAVEVEMRTGRSRTPRRDTSYFSAFGPHLVMPCAPGSPDGPPPGTRLGVGIDHGSKPGAQRAVMSAVGGSGLLAKVWTFDEYKGDGRTESEQDARGILAMLDRHRLRLEDVDVWVGDRGHRGDRRGGVKSNERLKRAIAEAIGLDARRRGWHERLPRNLQRMVTPRKYDRSVWEGCEVMHRLMVGDRPRLTMDPRCVHLAEDLAEWEGALLDPHKDGIDAWRYAVVPMVEGVRR